MKVLWENDECSVREVQRLLHRKIAYTTVMTTLTRLFRKELAKRRFRGKGYIYAPQQSREQFARFVAENTFTQFLETPNASRELLLSCLVKGLVQHDTGLVSDLNRALHQSRRAKKRVAKRSDRP